MSEIPLPSSNNSDIYSFGYDKGLNRNADSQESPLVYDIIGGATQAPTVVLGSLTAGSGSSNLAIDPTKGLWLGASVFEDAPFRVNMQGAVTATSGTFSGSISATTGSIGGWSISSNALTSGSVIINSTNEQLLFGSATAPLTGTGIFLGKDGSDYEFRVGNPVSQYMHWTGSTLNLVGGVVTNLGTGTDLQILGWQFDATFTSSTFETVTWLAGTLTFANGVTYSIVAGSATISATTYIYFDSGASTTVLQTTTTATSAVGANKVLIGVISPNSDSTKKASMQIFGGTGGSSGIITGDQIVANTISATELSTTLLYAGTITLDSLGHIKGGQTGFDTGTGFFLGSSSGAYKFSIGSSSGQRVTWDGSSLYVKGSFELASPMNLVSYTVANLPIPPTSVGFNSPSAVE